MDWYTLYRWEMDLGQYQPLEMTTEMLRGTPLHYSQGQCEEEEDHEGVQGCTNEADNTPDITLFADVNSIAPFAAW